MRRQYTLAYGALLTPHSLLIPLRSSLFVVAFSSQFEETFGSLVDADRLAKLHEVIGSYILRRLKDDVEKSVPPKAETLISCVMPLLQKQQYRAIYEKNVKLLAVDLGHKVKGPR